MGKWIKSGLVKKDPQTNPILVVLPSKEIIIKLFKMVEEVISPHNNILPAENRLKKADVKDYWIKILKDHNNGTEIKISNSNGSMNSFPLNLAGVE